MGCTQTCSCDSAELRRTSNDFVVPPRAGQFDRLKSAPDLHGEPHGSRRSSSGSLAPLGDVGDRPPSELDFVRRSTESAAPACRGGVPTSVRSGAQPSSPTSPPSMSPGAFPGALPQKRPAWDPAPISPRMWPSSLPDMETWNAYFIPDSPVSEEPLDVVPSPTVTSLEVRYAIRRLAYEAAAALLLKAEVVEHSPDLVKHLGFEDCSEDVESHSVGPSQVMAIRVFTRRSAYEGAAALLAQPSEVSSLRAWARRSAYEGACSRLADASEIGVPCRPRRCVTFESAAAHQPPTSQVRILLTSAQQLPFDDPEAHTIKSSEIISMRTLARRSAYEGAASLLSQPSDVSLLRTWTQRSAYEGAIAHLARPSEVILACAPTRRSAYEGAAAVLSRPSEVSMSCTWTRRSAYEGAVAHLARPSEMIVARALTRRSAYEGAAALLGRPSEISLIRNWARRSAYEGAVAHVVTPSEVSLVRALTRRLAYKGAAALLAQPSDISVLRAWTRRSAYEGASSRLAEAPEISVSRRPRPCVTFESVATHQSQFSSSKQFPYGNSDKPATKSSEGSSMRALVGRSEYEGAAALLAQPSEISLLRTWTRRSAYEGAIAHLARPSEVSLVRALTRRFAYEGAAALLAQPSDVSVPHVGTRRSANSLDVPLAAESSDVNVLHSSRQCVTSASVSIEQTSCERSETHSAEWSQLVWAQQSVYEDVLVSSMRAKSWQSAYASVASLATESNMLRALTRRLAYMGALRMQVLRCSYEVAVARVVEPTQCSTRQVQGALLEQPPDVSILLISEGLAHEGAERPSLGSPGRRRRSRLDVFQQKGNGFARRNSHQT